MNTHNKQKGFTLVEIMIALVLSLLVTYGIAQVLITTNQSSSSSDGVSQAQETARFVMSFFGRQVRTAGTNSIDNDAITTVAAVGCNGGNLLAERACSMESNAGATEANITTAPGVTSGDRFAIVSIPPAVDFQYPTPPGTPAIPAFNRNNTDCTGATPTGFTNNSRILNVFWVERDPATNTNSLFCQGYLFDGTNVDTTPTSGTAGRQVIANGVEAMHVLYGEADTPSTDGTRNVSMYVTADQVADWNNVYAIKIAVMTRSISDITNIVTTKQYVMLDSGLYSFNDAVNRQVFSSTFSINN
jgi:type IV pilus assembly protein PilW